MGALAPRFHPTRSPAFPFLGRFSHFYSHLVCLSGQGRTLRNEGCGPRVRPRLPASVTASGGIFQYFENEVEAWKCATFKQRGFGITSRSSFSAQAPSGGERNSLDLHLGVSAQRRQRSVPPSDSHCTSSAEARLIGFAGDCTCTPGPLLGTPAGGEAPVPSQSESCTQRVAPAAGRGDPALENRKESSVTANGSWKEGASESDGLSSGPGGVRHSGQREPRLNPRASASSSVKWGSRRSHAHTSGSDQTA